MLKHGTWLWDNSHSIKLDDVDDVHLYSIWFHQLEEKRKIWTICPKSLQLSEHTTEVLLRLCMSKVVGFQAFTIWKLSDFKTAVWKFVCRTGSVHGTHPEPESVSEVWGKMLQRNLYHCKAPHMYSMKDKGFMQISMNLFFLCELSHLPSSHHSHKRDKVLF